jgi:hypothetical protein
MTRFGQQNRNKDKIVFSEKNGITMRNFDG